MRERYGQAFSSLPYTKTGPGSNFMEAFEKRKRIFTSDDDTRTWQLPLKMPDLDEDDSGIEGYDFEEDMVILKWYLQKMHLPG